MNARRCIRASGDRGAALPLVLGFVLLVGTITVALLAQSATSLRASRVSREHDAKVYATGSALDWAIQHLRVDPTLCAAGGSTATLDASVLEDLPDADPGRFEIEVSCTAAEGGSIGASGWSIFTTRTQEDPSPHDWSISTQGSASSGGKRVTGPIYNAGDVDFHADLIVADGFFRQRSTGGPCPPAPSRLVAEPALDPSASYSCISAIATPAPVRSLAELSDGNFVLNPPSVPIQDCRVFSPGRYTVAPDIQSGTTYFRPGVYLLDDVSLLVDNQTVVAGTDPDGPIPEPIQDACPDAVTTRNGVTFLLSGSSAVDLDRGYLEINGYYPNGPDGRGTVGVMQIDDATAAAWGVTVSGPTDEPAVRTGNGSGKQLIIDGNVYLTRSGVELQGTGNANTIELRGGVVARYVDLQASNSIGSLFISTTDESSARIVDLAVSVRLLNQSDEPIGKPINGVATIFIQNDPERSASVSSWRIDEDTTS